MIELTAEGPVTVCKDGDFGPRKDGHDTVWGAVELTRKTHVDIVVEFEQGHVNLEGYAPSHVGWPIDECIGGFVSEAMDLPYGMLNYEDREWDVKLRASYEDWIQQAHRYMTERPNMSLLNALNRFQSWDETDDDTLELAKSEVAWADLSEYPPKSDVFDWDVLRVQLNELDHVEIPESYSD